jgi:uncharacterized cupredoxin-like copper-binding protein
MRGGRARSATARKSAAALVALAALTAAPARSSLAAGSTAVVEITIHHSRFTPSDLTVRPGRVRFVIRNTDPIDHEFILGDRLVQLRHEAGTETSHGARLGEVTVAAKQIATTTYIFSKEKPLLFGCHLPGHYAYGMRGLVRVG